MIEFNFFKNLFHVWCVWNLLQLGMFFHPEWLHNWAKKQHTLWFKIHGISVNVVLLLCTGDWWFKWLGGIALVTSLFCLGTEISHIKSDPFTYDNLKMLILLNAHHLGPIIAFYCQPPEHAWTNALFFGHVWWIHGKGLFDAYVKPTIEKVLVSVFDLELENRNAERGYAVVTVLASGLYLSYLPLGWNYSTAAFLSQFTGRNVINDNYLNVDWMREIELPGVIAVAMWNLGPVPVICVYLAYALHVHYRTREKSAVKLPERFVMSDEIAKFMAEFKRKVQDEKANKEKGDWFDSMGAEWEQYAFFKHVMLGNEEEVAKMLADGTDPNMCHKLWHDSYPMAWAAASSQIGVMVQLIEAGAFPFNPEWKKSAKMFKATEAIRFLDELVPLVVKALRDEHSISY